MMGRELALIARYLANKPAGPPEWYLVAAVVLFAVAAVVAGWARDVYRAAIAVGLGTVALALLTH